MSAKPNPGARSFVDAAGRPWVVRFDVAACRRVAAFTGLDALTDGLLVAGRTGADPVALADVMFAVCVPSVATMGRAEFDAGIHGDALDDAAAAVVAALTDAMPPVEPGDERRADAAATPGDPWRAVYSLAAVAGVDPGPFTVAELAEFATGRSRDRWNHTASLMAAVINANPYRKGPGVKPADLNPIGKRDAKRAPKPITRVGVEALRWMFFPNMPDVPTIPPPVPTLPAAPGDVPHRQPDRRDEPDEQARDH